MNKYCKRASLLAVTLLPLAAEPKRPVAPVTRVDDGAGLGLGLDLGERAPQERLAGQDPARPALAASPAQDPAAEWAFDDEGCLAVAPLAQAAGRFQPMIQEQEAGLVPSAHFVTLAPMLAELNRLGYLRGGLQSPDPAQGGRWTLPAPPGWNLLNLSGARGLWQLGEDLNAGFVGYHAAQNTVVVCFHGALTLGDWLENLKAWAEPVQALAEPETAADGHRADPIARLMVGKVHSGFLHRARSCRMQVRAHVDALVAGMTPEQRAQAKFYVTGHRQGAALGQVAIGWLCQDLRRHYGPEFSNARENRVHGWFLDAPAALDPTAAAFVNGLVGRRNILVQEATLDLGVHAPGRADGVPFKSVGTLAVQSNWDTFTRSLSHYRNRIARRWADGEYGRTLAALVPANPFRPSIGSAHRMSTAADSTGFTLDADMVAEVQADLTWALQNARDREQRERQEQANPSWGQWLRSRLGW